MKRARRSLSFLRASLRLCLLVLGLAAGSLVVSGAGPAWWAQRGVTNAQPPDDYAAANQGQLKNIATHAFHELEEQLASINGVGSMTPPNGTGFKLTQLIQEFAVRRTNPIAQTDDYAAVNLGQLKNVAKPFYDRLIEIGFIGQYPWTGSANPADDYAVANLGQLKNVFSFDLSGFDVSLVDIDGDGMTDLWEIANGFDPADPADASGDADLDGLSNLQESQTGTDPNISDSDGDGIPDGEDAQPLGAAPYALTSWVSVPDVDANLPDPDRTTVKVNWMILAPLPGVTQVIVQKAAGRNAPWIDTAAAGATVGNGEMDDSGLFSCLIYRYRLVLLHSDGKKTPCSATTYEVPLLRTMHSQIAHTSTWFPGFTDPNDTGGKPTKYKKQTESVGSTTFSPFLHKFTGTINLPSGISQSITTISPYAGSLNGSFTASYSFNWVGFGSGLGNVSQTFQLQLASLAPNAAEYPLVYSSPNGTGSEKTHTNLDPLPYWKDEDWASGTLTTSYTDSNGVPLELYPYVTKVEHNVGPPFTVIAWPFFRYYDANPPTYSEVFSTDQLVQLAVSNLPALAQSWTGVSVLEYGSDSGTWSYEESNATSAWPSQYEMAADEYGVTLARGRYRIIVNPRAANPDRPPLVIVRRTFYPKDDPLTVVDESLAEVATVTTWGPAAGQSESPFSPVIDLLDANPVVQGSVGIEVSSLLPVEFKKMWETKNKANQIFNPTKKDDPAHYAAEPPDSEDNVSGTAMNDLYVVADPQDGKCGITLALNLGGNTNFVAAVYEGVSKASGSDKPIPTSGEVDMRIDPASRYTSGFRAEIRVGYDRNSNGLLDSGEEVDLKVPSKFDLSTFALPKVEAISTGEYNLHVLTALGVYYTPGLPGARNAFRVFYDSSAANVGTPPPTSSFVTFDAFSSAYSEWLTHNSGTGFDATGVDNHFAVYTWGPLSALGKVVGESYTIKKATQDFFDTNLRAQVIADMNSKPSGSPAIDYGSHDIPHTHQSTTSFVPKTTVFFGDPSVPDLIDDEFAAVGRGRLLSHSARFAAEKRDEIQDGGVMRTVIRIKAFPSGEVDDLYDFNYNAGGLSETGSSLQLGYGNGSYGRNRGVIYLSKINFDSQVEWTIEP